VELSFVGDVGNPELEDVPTLDRVWLCSLFEDGPHASISANAAMAIADMNNFAMSAPMRRDGSGTIAIPAPDDEAAVHGDVVSLHVRRVASVLSAK
jgi:hypothetical protein